MYALGWERLIPKEGYSELMCVCVLYVYIQMYPESYIVCKNRYMNIWGNKKTYECEWKKKKEEERIPSFTMWRSLFLTPQIHTYLVGWVDFYFGCNINSVVICNGHLKVCQRDLPNTIMCPFCCCCCLR